MKIEELQEQVDRCRRLAQHADPFTQQRLLNLAEEYEARIRAAEPRPSQASRSIDRRDRDQSQDGARR
jgi:hypothetical protein